MKIKQLIETSGQSGEQDHLIKKIKKEWDAIAKESVNVEITGGTYYGFCSELGVLRLYRKYHGAPNVDTNFSKSMNSFYFRLEPKF